MVHWVAYIPIARVFNVSFPHAPLVLGVLAASYFLASLGVRTLNSMVTDWLYFATATWLGVIFLLFSFVLVYQLTHVATGFDSRLVLGCLLVLVLTLSAYALVHGRQLIVRELTVSIEGLSAPIRLVHLSDIHVGTVHQKKYLERVVALTNEQKPDLVLVTGDLFDGSAPIDKEILTPLNGLTAPSYFSNGNHEEYEGLERVKKTIDNLDMQLLDNELVEQGELQIVGVNDRQSLRTTTLASVLSSLPIDSDRPTLLMYHTPVDWDVAREHGADLMLSGHTHNGQLHPFNLLVRLFFKYINGLYEVDGQYLHVSPGTGTWGPPMRLGSRNTITVITLDPA